ncbi:hypothetical protein [Mucilaginibacter sp. FT3.2]|uniref:hypothetical protein n=1 Tax=Mucilaginibacter sp. FT3.2 TaxID=2723090 RepID=UPI0016135752|nr:hypothetical protein [Mucilaginibacter sp. FT3.2]MBB6229647.1 hypothetical protein [Mucilaginibacter sp. FT3.2]
MKRNIIYLLFLICFFSACNQQPKKQTAPVTLPNSDGVVLHKSKEVSIISLIANPDKYEGEEIRVIGYLHIEFEGNVLCLHKDDYDNAISKNAIWVDVTRLAIDSLKKYSDHYVIIAGTFDSRMRGHMDMNSGSIKNITRLDLWEPAKWRTVTEKK